MPSVPHFLREAGSGHALDGEQHVGLEVDGQADQEEIEFERIFRWAARRTEALR